MGQPHKGDRLLIAVRVDIPVWAAAVAAAENSGTSLSQYVADRLAIHVGRPDLVSTRPNKSQQRLRRVPATTTNGRVYILTRPPREIGLTIHSEAKASGISASQYVANLLAELVNGSGHRMTLREEQLLLAM